MKVLSCPLWVCMSAGFFVWPCSLLAAFYCHLFSPGLFLLSKEGKRIIPLGFCLRNPNNRNKKVWKFSQPMSWFSYSFSGDNSPFACDFIAGVYHKTQVSFFFRKPISEYRRKGLFWQPRTFLCTGCGRKSDTWLYSHITAKRNKLQVAVWSQNIAISFGFNLTYSTYWYSNVRQRNWDFSGRHKIFAARLMKRKCEAESDAKLGNCFFGSEDQIREN